MNKETKTILLVEDQAIVALAESRMLNGLGYDVVIAGTGEKALALIRAEEIVDLVLMDIDLGQGINGIETAGIILRDYKIPVVFLSSHEDPVIIQKAKEVSKYGYIVKIPAANELRSKLENAFDIFENGGNEVYQNIPA